MCTFLLFPMKFSQQTPAAPGHSPSFPQPPSASLSTPRVREERSALTCIPQPNKLTLHLETRPPQTAELLSTDKFSLKHRIFRVHVYSNHVHLTGRPSPHPIAPPGLCSSKTDKAPGISADRAVSTTLLSDMGPHRLERNCF